MATWVGGAVGVRSEAPWVARKAAWEVAWEVAWVGPCVAGAADGCDRDPAPAAQR